MLRAGEAWGQALVGKWRQVLDSTPRDPEYLMFVIDWISKMVQICEIKISHEGAM